MKKSHYISLVLLVVIIILAVVLNATQDTSKVELVVEKPVDVQPVESTVSDTYYVNTQESSIKWAASKTFIEGYTDTGTVDVKEGAFQFTEGVLVDGMVRIDMTSITPVTTGVGGGLDRLGSHLSSADFFDVEQYPEASFTITDVAPHEQEGVYAVTGDLTIKDTTETLETIVYASQRDTSIVVTTNLEIDRTLFDVRFGSGKFFQNLGDKTIDDTFQLEVVLVGEPQ